MVRIQLLGHHRASTGTHLVDGQLAIIPSIFRRKNNYTDLTTRGLCINGYIVNTIVWAYLHIEIFIVHSTLKNAKT